MNRLILVALCVAGCTETPMECRPDYVAEQILLSAAVSTAHAAATDKTGEELIANVVIGAVLPAAVASHRVRNSKRCDP